MYARRRFHAWLPLLREPLLPRAIRRFFLAGWNLAMPVYT